jgi:hypothetical protein
MFVSLAKRSSASEHGGPMCGCLCRLASRARSRSRGKSSDTSITSSLSVLTFWPPSSMVDNAYTPNCFSQTSGGSILTGCLCVRRSRWQPPNH